MKIRICLSIAFTLLCGISAFAAETVAIVVKSCAVVRQEPNAKSKALLTAKKGRRFTIVQFGKGWLRVYLAKGRYGWIPASQVTTRVEEHFLEFKGMRDKKDLINE